MNRRPIICGCRVFTNTATRHIGMPQATSRSHNWDNTSCGCGADRAPSISQSAIAVISGSSIEAELIVSTSWLILQADALLEQRDGDRTHPASSHPRRGGARRRSDPLGHTQIFAEIDAAF